MARDIHEKTGAYGTHYHTWLSCVANWSVCDGVNTLADGEYSDLKYFYELYQGLEDEEVCMSLGQAEGFRSALLRCFRAGQCRHDADGLLVRLHPDRLHQGRHRFHELGHRFRSAS